MTTRAASACTTNTTPAAPSPDLISPLLHFLRTLSAFSSLVLNLVSSILYSAFARFVLRSPPWASAGSFPAPRTPGPGLETAACGGGGAGGYGACVIVTGTGTGLARELAVRFACAGHTAFIQCAGQGELSSLLLDWSRVKSRIAAAAAAGGNTNTNANMEATGALIPLVYGSRDAEARQEAAKTVRAYVKRDALEVLALINCIDPPRSKRATHANRGLSPSPSSPSLSPPPCPLSPPPASSSQQSLRPKAGRRGNSNLAASIEQWTAEAEEAWREVPLPLGIATDGYLSDLEGEVTVPLVGAVQDFLSLLRTSSPASPRPGEGRHARVINVWASLEGAGSSLWAQQTGGPMSVALETARSINRTLRSELEGLGAKVSLVIPGKVDLSDKVKSRRINSDGSCGRSIGKPGKRRSSTAPTVSVTNDLRSILAVASDPLVRAHFDALVRLHLRLSDSALATCTSSDAGIVFATVRGCIGERWPRAEYPVGMDSWARAGWVGWVPGELRMGLEGKAMEWLSRRVPKV